MKRVIDMKESTKKMLIRIIAVVIVLAFIFTGVGIVGLSTSMFF